MRFVFQSLFQTALVSIFNWSVPSQESCPLIIWWIRQQIWQISSWNEKAALEHFVSRKLVSNKSRCEREDRTKERCPSNSTSQFSTINFRQGRRKRIKGWSTFPNPTELQKHEYLNATKFRWNMKINCNYKTINLKTNLLNLRAEQKVTHLLQHPQYIYQEYKNAFFT